MDKSYQWKDAGNLTFKTVDGKDPVIPETDKIKLDPATCPHKNITTWNHGYHNLCEDCGEKDV